MSCSKIFSGDLPELTYDIIKYFKNDFSTLHSCILVNRLWCRLAIPLLWENPFSISTKNYNFIEFYLNNLNNDLRSKLNEYKINDNLLPSSTLFNYPSFIKYLNTGSIFYSISKWFDSLKPGRRYFLLDSDSGSVLEFKKLISMLLFKLFIENEVNLHIFEIEVINYLPFDFYLDDILELILQNQNFIHNIKNFKLYIMVDYSIDNIKIKSINNRISEMISNSHQILKRVVRIVLSYISFPIYQSLLLSNNCSNSLNTIIFYHIDFHDIINLDKVFEQFNVLESVHIFKCFSLNNFTQQIINSTKPFKLKSFFLSEMIKIESLELLLQKSCDYLENFWYFFMYNDHDLQLLELILKYCKNIKFLDLYNFKNQFNYLVLDLIEDMRQKLNYLTIDIHYFTEPNPLKLEYLCLELNIYTNDFEIFLKNSQYTFINKLVIKNTSGDHDNMLSCIKENIMKKKRVKYLAIMDAVFDEYNTISENIDLFSLENEVKEFEFYNIIVREYIDLKFNLTDISFEKI